MTDEGDSTRVTLRAPAALARFVAPKGSVALNGTSLTVNEVKGDTFGSGHHTILGTENSTSLQGFRMSINNGHLHVDFGGTGNDLTSNATLEAGTWYHVALWYEKETQAQRLYINGTNVGLGININDVARALQGDRVTNSIEILLRNEGGEDPNVYSAESVADSIRPEVFQ